MELQLRINVHRRVLSLKVIIPILTVRTKSCWCIVSCKKICSRLTFKWNGPQLLGFCEMARGSISLLVIIRGVQCLEPIDPLWWGEFCMFCCSSICWSSYHKGLLASSDYEGTVTLWDAFTGSKTRSFQVRMMVMMMIVTSLSLYHVLRSPKVL